MSAMQTTDEGWRLTHLGRLMGHALRRFDARVLQLMAPILLGVGVAQCTRVARAHWL